MKDKVKNFLSIITEKKMTSLLFKTALASSSAILLYLATAYGGILIWITFVPIIYLAYKNKFKNFLTPAIIYSLLVALFLTHFMLTWLKGSGLILFVEAYFFVMAANLIFTISLNLLLTKIKYPYEIFIAPTIWFLIISSAAFIPGCIMWFNFSCLQPMLYPLTYFFGQKGMAFVILLVNSLVAFYLITKNKKYKIGLIAMVIILLSCFIYSYFAVASGKKVKIALIQGNFSKSWEWRTAHSGSDIISTYINLSKEAAKSQPDIIVWPEYAIPDDVKNNQDLKNKISELAKETDAYLVVGSIGTTDKTDPKYNFTSDVANVFSKNGDYLGTYSSIAPFPFDNEVTPGNALPVFDTGFGKFGVSLCYEEHFGDIYKNYAKSGAQFFVSLANDDPLKVPWTVKYKSDNVRLRAAENGKYLIRANNTGITEVINPYGKIVAQLPQHQEGFLIADIYVK